MAKKNKKGKETSSNKVLLAHPMRYFNNPYNFVPLEETVYARYPDAESLPCHDSTQDNLLCGEIRCTITAETPLSVSDGKEGFFRNAKGDYVIPGSTLKGLVRSNMQILGFGALRPGEDFNDSRMMYRVVASSTDGVKKELQRAYQGTLGIKSIQKTNPVTNKRFSYSVAENVRAGYLVQRAVDQKYVIYPMTYYKVNRALDCASRWKNRYTQVEEVWYQLSQKGTVTQLVVGNQPQPEGTLSGLLVCTGRAVGKLPNHLYLLPAFDAAVKPFELSNEDIKTYLTDYELRKNTLKGTDRNAQMDASHWKPPHLEKGSNQDTKPWPVFYAVSGKNHYFGRSPFLRVGYHHSLREGLPLAHQLAGDSLMLDYPYAMLGFTWSEPNVSYRSRVFFGDFVADTKPLEQTIPVVLSNPKPSSFADYTKDGKNYNQDFRIRGVKQYWLKQAQQPEVSLQQSKVKDELKVMSEQTHFSGVIRFHNLHDDELGLLLWSLRLNKGCYQGIGKGKPLGYGRSTVVIDSVEQYLPAKLYSADCLNGASYTQPLDADALIETYQNHIAKHHLDGKAAEEQPSVRDFLSIRSVIREAEQVRYLNLKEYQNRQEKELLPTVEEQRKNPLGGQRELKPLKENRIIKGKVLKVFKRDHKAEIKLFDYDLIGTVFLHYGQWLEAKQVVSVRILPGSIPENNRLKLELVW